MKNLKIILLLMLVNFKLHAGAPEDYIKKGSNNDPQNPALTVSYAAASGAVCYILLRSIERRLLEIKGNKLTYLFNMTASSLVPGLIFADVMDDGKLNGSSFVNLFNALQGNKSGAKGLFDTLIKRAGITNVITAFLGALLADHISS